VFAAACKLARQFTRPVVISRRTFEGKVTASIGSFVVLNNEGWFLTAWHIMDLLEKLQQSHNELRDWQAKEDAINAQNLTKRERTKALQAIGRPTKSSVRNSSVWWSWDNVTVADVSGIPDADLAVGRLTPFDSDWVPAYPVIKDPGRDVDQGTSLCRLGFPFQSPDVTPSFDEATNRFTLPEGTVPPVFPIEGILTRMVNVGHHSTLGYELSFIETSSAGFLGQSGGPIVDQRGAVWGIQSRTIHLPLGFSPPVKGGKKGEKEHQFLNVGWGVHPVTIVGHLRERGVAFALTSY
jgi:hypothetical protein